MSSFLVLVGSYTNYDALAHMACGKKEGEGIYTFVFSEGNLRPVSVIPAENPAVLVPHPMNPQKVYAISETIHERGYVHPINIDVCPTSGNVTATKSDKFVCNGYSTCYLSFSPDNKHGVLVSYWDSIIDVVEMNPNDCPSKTKQSFQQVTDRRWRQVRDKYDHWENRMVGPHAHSAHFWQNWIFIPDLGENAIFQYRFDDECALIEEAVIPLPEGCGPRHMSFHPNLDVVYVSNELNSTVCMCVLDKSNPDMVKPRLSVLQTEPTVEDEENDKPNYVAEVSLSPDGRFLYVSNRGHDSIAVFSVNPVSGRLARVGVFPSCGKTPRHFAVSPNGSHVIVANQDSCDITVFERCSESGKLEGPSIRHSVPSPNFVLCVPLPSDAEV